MRFRQDPPSTTRLRRALYRVAFSALRWTAVERLRAGGPRLPGSPQVSRLCLSAVRLEGAGAACLACTHPGAPCSYGAGA